ncbi:MAG: NUDIX hydrolase [Lysobacterales bacterium]
MSSDLTHYRGRYLSLLERDGWEYAHRSNASAVVVLVAVTKERELLLVEQFRKPVGTRVLELPAGLVGDLNDPDEPLLEAARRELEEETGYRPGGMKLLMECPSSAGMSDENLAFILAHDCERVGPGGGDDSEEIEVVIVSLEDADGLLDRHLAAGKSLDPKIYSGLYWLGKLGYTANSEE